MSYLVSGNNPAAVKTAERNIFTATAGQTTFTVSQGYQPGDLDVFLNGVRLVDGDDFNALNGSTVVLTSGAAVGDSLVVVCYRPYQVTDFYTKSEQDTRYVNASGDTMSGELIAPALTLDRRSWTPGLKIGTTSKDFAIYREWANNTNTISIGNITDGVESIRFDINGRIYKPSQPIWSGRQSGSATALGEIPFDSTYTRGGMSATTSRVTVPVAGYYQIMWSTHTYNNYTDYIGIRVNNSQVHLSYVNNGHSWNNIHLSKVIPLAANDYVSFYNEGSSGTYQTDVAVWSSLSIVFLG